MSSFLHRADVADPGIGSLPGQEPIRAKRSMSDSRQYAYGSHADGVVPARSSNLLRRRRRHAGLCVIKPTSHMKHDDLTDDPMDLVVACRESCSSYQSITYELIAFAI